MDDIERFSLRIRFDIRFHLFDAREAVRKCHFSRDFSECFRRFDSNLQTIPVVKEIRRVNDSRSILILADCDRLVSSDNRREKTTFEEDHIFSF